MTLGTASLQRNPCHRCREHGRSRVRCRKLLPVRAQAAATQERQQPGWTGDTILSRVVNTAINTPAIYKIMSVAAKYVIKNGAEQDGIPWTKCVQQLEQDKEVYQLKEQLENPNLVYPAYYLKKFHAYDEGNLNWLAAFELEPATYAMAKRTFKELSPAEANAKLRNAIMGALKDILAQHSLPQPQSILDVGCSWGLSARHLADTFPSASVTGLDLSPHFLAVAELYERRNPPQGRAPVRYVHGLAESTGLPDASVDVVSFQFVMHECPREVIQSFTQEAARILRPGGVLFMVDNNPKSPTIQNLPPVLFTLMKSTEPWSDSYYGADIEATFTAAGLRGATTVPTDHRHRTVLAYKPL